MIQHTADTITDDALDQLYIQLEQLRQRIAELEQQAAAPQRDAAQVVIDRLKVEREAGCIRALDGQQQEAGR